MHLSNCRSKGQRSTVCLFKPALWPCAVQLGEKLWIQIKTFDFCSAAFKKWKCGKPLRNASHQEVKKVQQVIRFSPLRFLLSLFIPCPPLLVLYPVLFLLSATRSHTSRRSVVPLFLLVLSLFSFSLFFLSSFPRHFSTSPQFLLLSLSALSFLPSSTLSATRKATCILEINFIYFTASWFLCYFTWFSPVSDLFARC